MKNFSRNFAIVWLVSTIIGVSIKILTALNNYFLYNKVKGGLPFSLLFLITIKNRSLLPQKTDVFSV